jgi:hypothetical protein
MMLPPEVARRHVRHTQVRRASAIIPLALLSAAWTLSFTSGANPAASTNAPATDRGAVLPDGSSVQAEALEAPASVSSHEDPTGSVGGMGGNAEQIVATSSTNGIPSAALAAYQRAETVINAADKTCHLPWQLVAAIGRVESDHGRHGGTALDADGTAQPGILGIALNGKNNTTLIRDTDAGQYDGDTRFDRAVGPMQFIPSTWSVVGVDADNDGVRNPQDIDDAALATAVYLCSGSGPTGDLATLAGKRASVYRYNHSQSYVDLVLSIADAYLEGDFTQVPDGITAAGYLSPDPIYPPPRLPRDPRGGGDGDDPGSAQPVALTDGPAPEATQEPAPEPTEGPTKPPAGDPSLPLPPVTVPTLPQTHVEPVDQVLTLAQAIAQCTLDGHVDNLLSSTDPFDRCVTAATTP